MAANDLHDLELVIRSHIPLIIAESHEERRVKQLFTQLAVKFARPLFFWSVTEGLVRGDFGDAIPQRVTADPTDLLKHIKASDKASIFVLPDFHPYLDDPVHVRLLKEIAHNHDNTPHTVVFVSHALPTPPELELVCARFELSLPGDMALEELVKEEAMRWAARNGNRNVRTDRKTLDALIRNLKGLTLADARRLTRGAIQDDGAITECDLPKVMDAKYKLLDRGGVLSFEYDTSKFAEVGGLRKLKDWLELRKNVFLEDVKGLDSPKGVMLVGVQGGGKSLAAKAVAGMWNVPLLRLDFGTLYNKYIGETEKNLREALKTAEVMSPCVLWIDEIEKAIAVGGGDDGGVSRRILGTLLTWMAEKQQPVFIVATANDIEQLPPELIRKGRLDEIFFVDLPGADVRQLIFDIHLNKREIPTLAIETMKLAEASEGFTGAEIEQVVVAALYASKAQGSHVTTDILLEEIAATRPLSVVMAEQMQALRDWADQRTVPAD